MRIGNDERESLRRNRETVYLRSGSMEYIRERSVGFALGDIALNAKYELAPFEERGVSIAMSGGLELPTGNATTLDGSGSLDAGLQVMASRDLPRGLGANRPLARARDS